MPQNQQGTKADAIRSAAGPVGPKVTSVELRVITPLEQAANGEARQFAQRSVWLLIRGDAPVTLGSGRYATVALAAAANNLDAPGELFAIKFLKTDVSDVFSKTARKRFYEEVDETAKFRDEAVGDQFVTYVGFGRLGNRPYPAAGTREFHEDKVIQEFGEDVVKSVETHNNLFGKVNAPFLSSLQGDFFVMHAAWGTLSDLLSYSHPWRTHQVFSLSAAQPARLLSELERDKRIPAIKFWESLGLRTPPRSVSGLQILREIGKRNAGLCYEIVLDLFHTVVDAIGMIHEAGTLNEGEDGDAVDDGGFAHRDLKPGNFLITRTTEHFSVTVTDLGFVSSIASIRRGEDSMAASSKEPGALASGSYMYRPPEQYESGYEIHFERDPANPKRIAILDAEAMRIEKGDWVECSEVKFETNERAPQKVNKTVIAAVGARGPRWFVDLEYGLERAADNQLHYLGYVVKRSGQHTDLFALGCILYHLVSGNKNPEEFYSQCLAEHAEPKDEIKPIYQSCLALSAMLCSEPEPQLKCGIDYALKRHADVIAELAMIKPKAGEASEARERRKRAAQKNADAASEGFKVWAPSPVVRAAVHRTIPPDGVGTWAYRKILSKSANLGKYVAATRLSPRVEYFSRDRNGLPIPFPILYEIVRCLYRDRPDSYARRTDSQNQGFLDVDLRHQAKRLASNIADMIAQGICLPNARKTLDTHRELGQNGVEVLCALRMCDLDDGESTVPPPPVDHATTKADTVAGPSTPPLVAAVATDVPTPVAQASSAR